MLVKIAIFGAMAAGAAIWYANRDLDTWLSDVSGHSARASCLAEVSKFASAYESDRPKSNDLSRIVPAATEACNDGRIDEAGMILAMGRTACQMDHACRSLAPAGGPAFPPAKPSTG